MTDKAIFNEYGHFLGEIPAEAVADCTAQGDCSEACAYWQRKLGFEVPRDKAIDFLAEFGAWPRVSDKYDTGLVDMSDTDLAIKVLWVACGDIKENGLGCVIDLGFSIHPGQ